MKKVIAATTYLTNPLYKFKSAFAIPNLNQILLGEKLGDKIVKRLNAFNCI